MPTGRRYSIIFERPGRSSSRTMATAPWGPELNFAEFKHWRRRSDSALGLAAFFIPVITPALFQSDECRAELVRFAGAAESLGVREPILPNVYIDLSALASEEGERDEGMQLVAAMQWVDWRELRLMEENSADYRQAINRLALRLSDVAVRVSQNAAFKNPILIGLWTPDDSRHFRGVTDP
jgi:hypothetical protein